MARQQEKAKRQGQQKLLCIPLGGLGEIGKNSMAIQYGNEIIVVDTGLAFPEEEMLGIDIVIPDYTYLLENRDKVKAVVYTHGHEDHIGGTPYFLRQLQVPLFATRLTLGLIEGKLAEHGLPLPAGSRSVKAGEVVKIGQHFTVEWIRVNHSIPDSCALAITTPVGTIVHTGDFKFDQTPVDGEISDYARLSQLGDQGVLALLADSTNAERPGYTPSEKIVGNTIDEIFRTARGRVLLATFASNVHRLQQTFDAAAATNRKVAVIGRSMENTVEIAIRLGYMHVAEGTLVEVEELRRFPANQQVILCTGSQGEPMSALTRMSSGDHKQIEIMPGDTVLLAASPIPGNEKSVGRTINNLYRRGAEVIYGRAGIHTSGHASQEEMKLMLNLVRPKFFVPIHGEYRMLVAHSRLAKDVGIPPENILIGENGSVYEFTPDTALVSGKVASGQVLVDGLGVGDVGNIVLRDRRQLSQDGILIVVVALEKETGLIMAGPDIVSRGFVYVRESEGLLEQARELVKEALYDSLEKQNTEWAVLKSAVRDTLGKYLFEKTRRRPMILPIIIEV